MHGEFLRKSVDAATATQFTAEVAEDWRSANLPLKEQVMLEHTEKIALSASTMTREDVERLRQAGWNDREILDITLVACNYNFMCRLADSLGVELDEGEVDSSLLNELERRQVTPVPQRQ